MFNKIKKILLTGAAAVMMLSPFSMTAAADNAQKVVDNAGVLYEDDAVTLENRIKGIVDKEQFDIVILTDYDTGGKSAQACADDYYDYNGYGIGKKKDGVLLFIATETRDWAICGTGFGEKVFPDEKCSSAGSQIAGYLHEGSEDYYAAFSKFIDITEQNIKDAHSKHTLRIIIGVLIGVGVGLLAALITILVLRSQLHSVSFEHGASNYEVQGSFHLTRSQDIFLFRNVKKTRKSSDSGGGHTGSSGTHHSGASGKF